MIISRKSDLYAKFVLQKWKFTRDNIICMQRDSFFVCLVYFGHRNIIGRKVF